jgi:hypothetical protein
LTKGDDGAWVGTTRPLDEGFHYYRINIDGADVPDPRQQVLLRRRPLGQRHRQETARDRHLLDWFVKMGNPTRERWATAKHRIVV